MSVDRAYVREIESSMRRHLRDLERELEEDPRNEELAEAVDAVEQQLRDAPWL